MSFKDSKQRRDYGKIVLNLEEISYCTYFYSVMANLRLKNEQCYTNVKTQLSQCSRSLAGEEKGVKNSIKLLLFEHRKCRKTGGVCPHMEALLERVKEI